MLMVVLGHSRYPSCTDTGWRSLSLSVCLCLALSLLPPHVVGRLSSASFDRSFHPHANALH